MALENLPWQVFIQRDLITRIEPVIDNITLALQKFGRESKHKFGPSVSGGIAGVALYFHYLATARPGSGYRREAEAFLDRAILGVQENELWFDLYTGVSGVAWAYNHIVTMEGGDDPLDEVDKALLQLVSRDDWPWLHDLISGLAGMGTYALSRYPRGRSPEIIDHVVRHLLATMETDDDGVTWFTVPDIVPMVQREQHPDGYYNLGVAHGTPAILSVLAGAAERGIQMKAAREAVTKGCDWIWAHQLDTLGQPRIPTVIEPGGKRWPSRLAWCYGDAGVACSLLEIGRHLEDAAIQEQALELALHSCGIARKDTGVVDGPLCHGAVGLAHIYGRLYQHTSELDLADSSRYWLEQTLEYFDPDGKYGGFKMKTGDDWQDSPGFLEGNAGVGLALLAATTDIEPNWDGLLALSLPD